jgi:hypothetical protein
VLTADGFEGDTMMMLRREARGGKEWEEGRRNAMREEAG